jgi:hypothetical protein
MARRGLPPREAHHLRGCRGPHPVRPQTIPQHPDPLNKQINSQTDFLEKKIKQCFTIPLFISTIDIRVKFI